MKKIIVSSFLGACALSLGLIGCGSGGVNSGVDKAKAGKDLTSDEAKKVCVAALDYAKDSYAGISKSQLCAFAGYTAAQILYATSQDDATIQAACKTTVDTCNSSSEQPSDGSDDATDAQCTGVQADSTCNSSVGDVETCATDVINAQTNAITSVPACDKLTRDYFAGLDKAEAPASCDTVKADCPDIAAKIGL
jgi:hypothetical protein